MLNKKNIWRITLLTNPDKCNLSCPLCFMRQRGYPFGMGEMPLALALRSITEYKETLKEVMTEDILDFDRAMSYPTYCPTGLVLKEEVKIVSNLDRHLDISKTVERIILFLKFT